LSIGLFYLKEYMDSIELGKIVIVAGEILVGLVAIGTLVVLYLL